MNYYKMKKLSIFSGHGLLSVLFLWIILFPEQYMHVLDTFYYSKIELCYCVHSFIISLYSYYKESFYI